MAAVGCAVLPQKRMSTSLECDRICRGPCIKGSPHSAPWEEGRPDGSGAHGSGGTGVRPAPPRDPREEPTLLAAGLASTCQRSNSRCFQPPSLWGFVRQPPGTRTVGPRSVGICLSSNPPIVHLSCTTGSLRGHRTGGDGQGGAGEARGLVFHSTLRGAA